MNSESDTKDLQRDVDLVYQWMQSQGLTPNMTKTQLVPITRSRRAPPININLNGHPISTCRSVRYLGVTISSNLSWTEHITSTCKKAKRHLGLLNRSLYLSPPHIRKQIYQSTILPKLEYCSSVWGPHYQTESTPWKECTNSPVKLSRDSGKPTQHLCASPLIGPPYPNAGRSKSSRYTSIY